MKIGIITLVSDNYGNKYQNYAVEQLLSEYGSVETFGLEEIYRIPRLAQSSIIEKMNPRYIRDVMISRPMYQYDINRIDKGVLYNISYVKRHRNELIALKEERRKRFEAFSNRLLHIYEKRLNRQTSGKDWAAHYDFFICGSDQIWNPGYATTSELAFCSFAPEKTVCLSPSFGVSKIPEYRKDEYADWIKKIYTLSVREEAGREIIKKLTGRDATVLLDPTMLLSQQTWKTLSKEPDVSLPTKYILCYFLGRLDKKYMKRIDSFAIEKNLPVVMLFDITTPQYYTFDPSEVLYAINNAEYILTDSFHGCVFSILFHKDFFVFERNEGENNLRSRINTLLKTFSLEDRVYGEETNPISKERWEKVNQVLINERKKTQEYLSHALLREKNN